MNIQNADALPGIERIRQKFLEMLEDRLDALEDAMVEFEFPGTGRASLSRAHAQMGQVWNGLAQQDASDLGRDLLVAFGLRLQGAVDGVAGERLAVTAHQEVTGEDALDLEGPVVARRGCSCRRGCSRLDRRRHGRLGLGCAALTGDEHGEAEHQ